MSAIVGRPSGNVFITWAHNQIQAMSAVNYMTDAWKKAVGDLVFHSSPTIGNYFILLER